MNTHRSLFKLFAVLGSFAAGTPTMSAAEGQGAADETALIRILQSDAPASEKAITCKKLAVFGSSKAVPSLAPLLADERLASWSRIALEAIPGPEADAALRNSLGTLRGRLLVGAINSIGVRRDAEAVAELVGRLQADDPQVASAAAVALGKIGDPTATGALRQALANAPDTVRSAVAEGCILCAERLWAEGEKTEAAEIYDEVRQANVPNPRILEATRGAILARELDGIPLLLENLSSPETGFVQIALSAARELSGREVTQALADELPLMNSDRAALVLYALADRGDRAALPVALEIAQGGPRPLRLAAMGVLGRLGDASCVPALLAIATANDAELAHAAKETLAQLPGDDVDREITSRLPTAQQALLAALIELVGKRQIEATPELLEAVDHPDAKVRAAALTALGATIEFDDLSALIRRVVAPSHPTDEEVAQQALLAACTRMPDREACAQELVSAMSSATLPAKNGILEVLGAMGGEQALAALGAFAQGAEPQLQDTASRLLGQWMTADAAPTLLEIAQSPDNRYSVRALRGYIRLARQFDMPERDRAAMCRHALNLARGVAEQKLVLEVIERYPTIEMLELAILAADYPEIKKDANRIAMAIAQELGGEAVDVRQLLARIGQSPVKLEIVKAEYGAGEHQKDVTEVIRRHAKNLPLIALPSTSYNASFGGDPLPGTTKRLKIEYRINGKAGEATFPENSVILLPD